MQIEIKARFALAVLVIFSFSMPLLNGQSTTTTSHRTTTSKSTTAKPAPVVPDANADLIGKWVVIGDSTMAGTELQCATAYKGRTDCSLVFTTTGNIELCTIQRAASNAAFNCTAAAKEDGTPVGSHVFLAHMQGNVLSGKLLPAKRNLVLYKADSTDAVQKQNDIAAIAVLKQYEIAAMAEKKQKDADAAAEKKLAEESRIWTDPATRLKWTFEDNGTDVNWDQATSYCANLRLGGYSDWRLATIDELQGIYDPQINVPGTCCGGQARTWHVKGNLQLSGWHWSSSRGTASGEAWLFLFYNGMRYSFPLTLSHNVRALCVSRSAP